MNEDGCALVISWSTIVLLNFYELSAFWATITRQSTESNSGYYTIDQSLRCIYG